MRFWYKNAVICLVVLHCCNTGERFALALHNLSVREVMAQLNLPQDDMAHVIEIFNDDDYGVLNQDNQQVRLNADGYRWFHYSRFTQNRN